MAIKRDNAFPRALKNDGKPQNRATVTAELYRKKIEKGGRPAVDDQLAKIKNPGYYHAADSDDLGLSLFRAIKLRAVELYQPAPK